MSTARRATYKSADTPNMDEVICPNCAHQFRAIPQNVQAENASLREELATRDALYKEQVRRAEQAEARALEYKTEHAALLGTSQWQEVEIDDLRQRVKEAEAEALADRNRFISAIITMRKALVLNGSRLTDDAINAYEELKLTVTEDKES